ncbi:Molybdenum cofactor sulfurtransferase protein [Dioscorea alata]|uniref:Molybdenum cofactor sulfurtransferase protein n=1 Tax=Dioscorea alata TaxID=55571 RepID=A0ACB7WEA1_DIOAL|nr:Molybdenum cofactor sulfurtransferase protein [Dioscorea alata]
MSFQESILLAINLCSMFSKLPTFRPGKASSPQNGKQSPFHRFNSLVPNKSASPASYDQQTYLNFDTLALASYISDETSSLDSPRRYSTSEGQESLTPSSAFSGERNFDRSALLPYDEAEEQFLEDYESYFLHLSVDNVRQNQYPKLESQRLTYLDHATCPLFSRFQVEQHMQFLLEDTHPFLGSTNIRGKQSRVQYNHLDKTCEHILDLLNTNKDEYSVIFTSGISSCYRHFGEMHHFPKGSLVLTVPDHQKFIQHMVQGVAQSNAKIGTIPLKKNDLCIHVTEFQKLLRKRGWNSNGFGLLAYPAQSSSGMCHSLNWIASAQQSGWKVLLDVSSCIPMVNVDLSLYQPEFVIGSLYHMLGYPSNVGFLLVRRSSHSICRETRSARLRIAELPEDGKAVHILTEGGSLNIHTFASLYFGLEHLQSIGVLAVQKRIKSLISWLVKTFKSLKHKLDDKPMLQLYGSSDLQHRGSILAFNVLDPTGSIFPARLVQQLAENNNVFLATGYQIEVLRLSLGPVSSFEDVYRLVQFLWRFRDEDYMSNEAAGYVEELEKGC